MTLLLCNDAEKLLNLYLLIIFVEIADFVLVVVIVTFFEQKTPQSERLINIKVILLLV
jgi:hypothetical protein